MLLRSENPEEIERNQKMNFDDPTVAQEFALDVIIESGFEPPGKIRTLLPKINWRQCCSVRIALLNDGAFFLRWKQLHPEMVSPEEFWDDKGETIWLRTEEQDEYKELLEHLPSRSFELSLTRRQAFAVIAACWLPEEFAEEIGALI